MSEIVKMIVVVVWAVVLVASAYAQEAAEPGRQEPGNRQIKQEPAREGSAGNPAEGRKQEPAGDGTARNPADGQKQEAAAEPVRPKAKEQMKGLDEQVQDIKSDVLAIAAQLNRLEEKLLYPSDTQIAIFVSVSGADKFRLDAVGIELDGKLVAHHLYTFKELEALQKGGVQRIHVGNVTVGEHPLHVTVLGKSEGGADFQRDESFKITKGIGPKLVGVVLSGTGIGNKTITLKDW